MKNLLLAILFFAFTLPANSQIEEYVEEEPEVISTVQMNLDFGASLRKLKDEYYIVYRDYTYLYLKTTQLFNIGTLEDVYEFKKILYNTRKSNKTKKFKIRENIFTVKPLAKKYLDIYILENGVVSRRMGDLHMKKLDKLIPRELFSKK
jgi:hypothetical protein